MNSCQTDDPQLVMSAFLLVDRPFNGVEIKEPLGVMTSRFTGYDPRLVSQDKGRFSHVNACQPRN